MATNRKDLKVTRLDLRIPNDIYSQVEEIARANNEPSHHITGNIILSPTLLKLISLGIRSLSGNYNELADIPTNIERVPDTLSPRVDTVERELADLKKVVAELSAKLSGEVSDSLASDTIPDSLSDNEEVESDSVSDRGVTISVTVADKLSGTNMVIADKVTDTMSDNLIPSTATPEVIDSIVTSKTTDKDPSTKTWVEFFKMIGMDALTATEAQKKENINIRTKQMEEGLKAAMEQGLGQWAIKRAGRDFVRVEGLNQA
jgi:hypothetical protein